MFGVFPTPVGVFPISSNRAADPVSLPHARGGVSAPCAADGEGEPSSPRPWGCFRIKIFLSSDVCVFPTPVGVFLYLYP